MTKLAMVGALAAALAWTNVRAEDPQKAKAEAREEVQKAQAEGNKEVAEAQKEATETKREADREVGEAKQEAREETAEARKDANEKVNEAQGTGSSADPSMPRRAAGDEKKHPLFEGKQNFDIEGRIQAASKSSITVRRDELPAAKLNVDRNTKIELDGEHVSAAQLKPGQEVKASFNLQNDKPMAVEIKAQKTDAQENREDQKNR